MEFDIKTSSPKRSVSVRLDVTIIEQITSIGNELRVKNPKISDSDVIRKAVDFFLSEMYTKRIQP